MVRSCPAGVILRPSGRMTLPSALRCAGSVASAEAGCATQLLLNEGTAVAAAGPERRDQRHYQ